jgi:RNA polymerase sigma factor (sigma-70 family)
MRRAVGFYGRNFADGLFRTQKDRPGEKHRGAGCRQISQLFMSWPFSVGAGHAATVPFCRPADITKWMDTSNDMQLLQEYASGHSEDAFAALVSRHINLVYSAALRSVNNPSQAEEITQAVFVTLARKSGALRRGTVLSGWLYQTARLTASNFIRTEMRRLHREQQAHIQSTMNDPEPEAWMRVGPLLDEAMAQLNEKDRNAIVLRFFEGKRLKEVGDALGASEDAAKMRVNRALDKLRDFFHRRGITVPADALAAAICENSIQAAPAGLAASVAAGAVQGSALTVSTLALVKGAIPMMTSTKIGVAIGVCAAAAIIALQYQQISTQKQTVKQLEAQVAQAAKRAQPYEPLQAEIEKLREQNASYAKTIEGMQRDVAKARAHASAALAAKAAAAATGTKGNPMADMFKDPEMLEAMRPQQLATFKMMYGPLVKQLNLSPEQADKFYNILVDNGIKGLAAMQSGNSEDIKSNTQSLEANLQSLLGDAGYAQYQNFTKNDVADQSLFTAMKNDFADNPLSDTQQQQLLQAMKTARQTVTANSPLDLSQANPSDKLAMMGQLLQQQEQMNQNVLQQAATFLSPDQLQTLGTSQSNMIAMQKSMAPIMQKMFNKAPAGP